MQNAAVDDDVITLMKREVAVDRLEDARALRDVDALVGLRIPIEVRIRLVRLGVQHRDVVVEHQRNAIERRAAARLHLGRLEVAMPKRLILIGDELHVADPLRRLDRRRRMHVIQQRRGAGESLVAHQLFGVDAAVGLSEGSVAFSRYRP